MTATEGVGPYWKPLYSLFELLDLNAMIVNPAHMKAVPRRKTDVKDAKWLAELLQLGLLPVSLPPAGNLIVCKRHWMAPASSWAVWQWLVRIVAGTATDNSGEISKRLHKSLLSKLDKIVLSLDGIVTSLQQVLLAQILNHISDADRRIKALDQMAEAHMESSSRPLQSSARCLESPSAVQKSFWLKQDRHKSIPSCGASVLLCGSLPGQP